MSVKIAPFILLIFNCQKYRYKAIKQKETWLKNFSMMPYFHVIGDPELTKDYVIDEAEHILFVKTPDDYVSLPKKVISAYEAIYKEYCFNYILKTDDDQNLIKPAFLNMIQNLLLKKMPPTHYGGQIIDVEQPYISQYSTIHPELPENLPILKTKYCSGRFYILSDLAIQQLLTRKELIGKEYLEDYAIGYYLSPILKKNILDIQTNNYFVDFDDGPAVKEAKHVYNYEDELLAKGYGGRYIVVKPDMKMMVVSTETEAIDFAESNPGTFFHRIGITELDA